MINKIKQIGIVKLEVNGKMIEFFVLSGMYGFDVVDVKCFYVEGGVFIFDFGFMLIGLCESQIMFINGEEGILLYCGYLID